MNSQFPKISLVVTWSIVVVVGYIYFSYLYKIRSLTETIVSLVPALVFITLGILVHTRDRKKTKHFEANNQFYISARLTWKQQIKHDLLMYLAPVLTIITPFFFGQNPNLTDVLQACILFLSITYLKILYWNDL